MILHKRFRMALRDYNSLTPTPKTRQSQLRVDNSTIAGFNKFYERKLREHQCDVLVVEVVRQNILATRVANMQK